MQCPLPAGHVASTRPTTAAIFEAPPRHIVRPQSPYKVAQPQHPSLQGSMFSPRRLGGSIPTAFVKPAAVVAPPRLFDMQQANLSEAKFAVTNVETPKPTELVQLDVALMGQSSNGLLSRRSLPGNSQSCGMTGSFNAPRSPTRFISPTRPPRPIADTRNVAVSAAKPGLKPRSIGACKSGRPEFPAQVVLPHPAASVPARSNADVTKAQAASSDVVEVLRNLAEMVRSTASSMQVEVTKQEAARDRASKVDLVQPCISQTLRGKQANDAIDASQSKKMGQSLHADRPPSIVVASCVFSGPEDRGMEDANGRISPLQAAELSPHTAKESDLADPLSTSLQPEELLSRIDKIMTIYESVVDAKMHNLLPSAGEDLRERTHIVLRSYSVKKLLPFELVAAFQPSSAQASASDGTAMPDDLMKVIDSLMQTYEKLVSKDIERDLGIDTKAQIDLLMSDKLDLLENSFELKPGLARNATCQRESPPSHCLIRSQQELSVRGELNCAGMIATDRPMAPVISRAAGAPASEMACSLYARRARYTPSCSSSSRGGDTSLSATGSSVASERAKPSSDEVGAHYLTAPPPSGATLESSAAAITSRSAAHHDDSSRVSTSQAQVVSPRGSSAGISNLPKASPEPSPRLSARDVPDSMPPVELSFVASGQPQASRSATSEILRRIEKMENQISSERQAKVQLAERFDDILRDRAETHARDIAGLERTLARAMKSKNNKGSSSGGTGTPASSASKSSKTSSSERSKNSPSACSRSPNSSLKFGAAEVASNSSGSQSSSRRRHLQLRWAPEEAPATAAHERPAAEEATPPGDEVPVRNVSDLSVPARGKNQQTECVDEWLRELADIAWAQRWTGLLPIAGAGAILNATLTDESHYDASPRPPRAAPGFMF